MPRVLLVLLAVLLRTTVLAQDATKVSGSKIEYFELDSPAVVSSPSVRVGVYLPAEYRTGNRFPVVYYLGGFGEDEKAWQKLGIDSILDDLIAKKKVEPIIVVTADSRDTGWLNWIDGTHQWEEFIVKDLVLAIDKKYSTAPEPCRRGISGNSMGGLAALKIGFSRPDIFGSVSAHSAALHPVDPAKMPGWAKGWDGWKDRMGDPIDQDFWKTQNPLHLAATLPSEKLSRQRIYFDVGDKDHLGFNATNILLDKALTDRGIPHSFHLRPGGHGSSFVKEYARFAIEFHGRAFSTCRG